MDQTYDQTHIYYLTICNDTLKAYAVQRQQ